MDRIMARFAGAILFCAGIGTFGGDTGAWIGAGVGVLLASWLTYEIHRLEKKDQEKGILASMGMHRIKACTPSGAEGSIPSDSTERRTMTKRMKLRGTVTHSETLGMYKVTSQHYDGTPFALKVPVHEVILNEPITEEKDVVEGWLLVDHVGEQGDRAFIVMPAASIEYGRNLSVSVHQLLPAHVTIQDYMKNRESPTS
jgi:hypothetical protein